MHMRDISKFTRHLIIYNTCQPSKPQISHIKATNNTATFDLKECYHSALQYFSRLSLISFMISIRKDNGESTSTCGM